jgi:hypothetical protein
VARLDAATKLEQLYFKSLAFPNQRLATLTWNRIPLMIKSAPSSTSRCGIPADERYRVSAAAVRFEFAPVEAYTANREGQARK